MRLQLKNIGQISEADIRFGDLTVFVGPQATGKSIALEFLKLVLDLGHVQEEMTRYGIDWSGELPRFFDAYFGEGMSGLWRQGESKVSWAGRTIDLPRLIGRVRKNVAVHRCSSSCFAEAFAREYGHQWTTIGVSGYGSWLVSTSRSLIRCSRRGCRRHRRTHFRTSRSLQTLHPSTPPALRSLRLPATVMAARCQRTTPQLPPPSTQTPIALAVCKSRSLSRSVRTSGFPFHSLYPA